MPKYIPLHFLTKAEKAVFHSRITYADHGTGDRGAVKQKARQRFRYRA